MELVITQEQRLIEQEAIIDEGKDTFLKVGRALLIIRSEQLYKKQYPRFEDYCRARHGFTRKNAYETINAMLAVDGLLPIGDSISKDAALELGKIKDKVERQAVYMAAKKLQSDVTAPIVRSAINVLETARITDGYVDTGNGRMTPLDAALTQEVADRKERQLDHIRAKNKNPELIKKTCTLQQACEMLATLTLERGDDVTVKLLVYELQPQAVQS